MSRTTRTQAARRRGEDRLAALRLRQAGIAAALADREQQIVTGTSTQPAADPHDVIVHTIVEMARAFPGMDNPAAARLLSEADQAHREGPAAAGHTRRVPGRGARPDHGLARSRGALPGHQDRAPSLRGDRPGRRAGARWQPRIRRRLPALRCRVVGPDPGRPAGVHDVSVRGGVAERRAGPDPRRAGVRPCHVPG